MSLTPTILLLAAAVGYACTGLCFIPPGEAGIRVDRLRGRVDPHTLYPGMHWAWPGWEHIERTVTRDQIYGAPRRLRVKMRDGSQACMEVALRYRIDPERLIYRIGVTPADFEDRYLRPLLASQLRALAPRYESAGELFASKREEYRAAAVESISGHLRADGIVAQDLLIEDLSIDDAGSTIASE